MASDSGCGKDESESCEIYEVRMVNTDATRMLQSMMCCCKGDECNAETNKEMDAKTKYAHLSNQGAQIQDSTKTTTAGPLLTTILNTPPAVERTSYAKTVTVMAIVCLLLTLFLLMAVIGDMFLYVYIRKTLKNGIRMTDKGTHKRGNIGAKSESRPLDDGKSALDATTNNSVIASITSDRGTTTNDNPTITQDVDIEILEGSRSPSTPEKDAPQPPPFTNPSPEPTTVSVRVTEGDTGTTEECIFGN